MPGRAEGVAREHVAHGGERFVHGLREDHALAGGEAVGLDHDGRAGFFDISLSSADVREIAIGGGRDFMAREEILGEGFRAFELGGVLRRAKDAQARGAEFIHHAQHQRRLGADHGEMDFVG